MINFVQGLVYFIEINVIVCNVYSALEYYCTIFAAYISTLNNPTRRITSFCYEMDSHLTYYGAITVT